MPSPVSAETWHGACVAVSQAAPRHLVAEIDLVQHEQARKLIGADLGQHRLDGGDLRDELVLVGRGVARRAG